VTIANDISVDKPKTCVQIATNAEPAMPAHNFLDLSFSSIFNSFLFDRAH
jgi:hypothetical protein